MVLEPVTDDVKRLGIEFDKLLDEMERSDKETGLATLCIGSGMGAATIIERV